MRRHIVLAFLLTLSIASPQLARADGLRQACMADFHKFCPGAAAVLGPMKCMKQHAEELSDACKQAWAARQKSRPAGTTDKASGRS